MSGLRLLRLPLPLQLLLLGSLWATPSLLRLFSTTSAFSVVVPFAVPVLPHNLLYPMSGAVHLPDSSVIAVRSVLSHQSSSSSSSSSRLSAQAGSFFNPGNNSMSNDDDGNRREEGTKGESSPVLNHQRLFELRRRSSSSSSTNGGSKNHQGFVPVSKPPPQSQHQQRPTVMIHNINNNHHKSSSLSDTRRKSASNSKKKNKSFVGIGPPLNDIRKPEYDDQGYTLYADETTGKKSRVFEALIDYPCDFTLKIIGRDHNNHNHTPVTTPNNQLDNNNSNNHDDNYGNAEKEENGTGTFIDDMISMVAQSCNVPKQTLHNKWSSRMNGQWTSLTIQAPVQSADMLYALYQTIDADPRVKFKF